MQLPGLSDLTQNRRKESFMHPDFGTDPAFWQYALQEPYPTGRAALIRGKVEADLPSNTGHKRTHASTPHA